MKRRDLGGGTMSPCQSWVTRPPSRPAAALLSSSAARVPTRRHQRCSRARARPTPDDTPVEVEVAEVSEEQEELGPLVRPPSPAEGGDSSYKPTASTSWGVFERPKNISKAYGGGRNIPFGGESKDPEELEEKRKKTMAKIAQYRKKRLQLDNADLEDDTLSKAKLGIERGKVLMRKGSLPSAREEFENAAKLVSPASTLGGEAQLQIAICCDSMGRYEEAKEKYKKLTTHRDYTIARQAENFLFGFDAMEELKTEKYKYDKETYRPYFDAVSTGEFDTMFGKALGSLPSCFPPTPDPMSSLVRQPVRSGQGRPHCLERPRQDHRGVGLLFPNHAGRGAKVALKENANIFFLVLLFVS